jgi:hypothetical protein
MLPSFLLRSLLWSPLYFAIVIAGGRSGYNSINETDNALDSRSGNSAADGQAELH